MTGSPAIFERFFRAGWADVDFNAHMRNTAFIDKAGDVRMMYFESAGFPMREFQRQNIGPVLRGDHAEYFREIRLMEEMRITQECAGLSDDGRKWRIRNQIYRVDGILAASVTSSGGWLHLVERKLVAPPEKLHAAMLALPRTPDFEILKSSKS